MTPETVWPNGATTPSDRAALHSMSKSYSRGVQSTASTDAERPTDQVSDYLPLGATRLGIDSEGRIHYWMLAHQRITIVEPVATTDGAVATVATNDAISPGDAFKAYIDCSVE